MVSGKITAYTNWIDRHRKLILAVSVLMAVIGGYLSASLPVHSNFSVLLPPSRQSVKDLNALKERVRTFGTIFVVVDGKNADATEKASLRMRKALAEIDTEDISEVVASDQVTRDFFWNNRFLYAPLEDLQEAHDQVKEEIRKAKLAANPLFIDLDDDEEEEESKAGDAEGAEEDKLVARLDEAEAKFRNGDAHITKDGNVRLFILRSTKPSTDFGLSERVLTHLDKSIAAIEADVPDVKIGVTGNVTAAYYEKQSVMKGILTSALITAAFIAFLLMVYFRAPLAVAASLWSLLVAVLCTFAIAYFTIGHLNVLSAFLVAIVAGNGINAGLMLLSRYSEEVRDNNAGNEGLAAAIHGAARGTFAASVAAGVAYGALIATDFRGFRHFGVIGSLGMVLCWFSAFSILPAGLCQLRAWGRIKPRPAPALGKWIGALSPKRPKIAALAGLLVLAVAAGWTVKFISDDPMESDWRNLSSDGEELMETRRLDERMRETLGRKFGAGLTSRFAVAVDEVSQVQGVVDTFKSAPKTLIDSVTSMNDLLPKDQEKKLVLLQSLREMLKDDAVQAMAEDRRETLARIHPPEGLKALEIEDVPRELTWPFIEKDGSKGKLILVAGSKEFKSWHVQDRMALAEGVRGLGLPDYAVVGGQSFVIADIIYAMRDDGLLASIIAVVGALLAVLLLLGVGRHGIVTVISGVAGIVGMIALCDIFGLKVNFLDLVALPITIGIGIDYSVNLAARDKQEPGAGLKKVLSATGGAVVLCSLTTIVGYGSLLISDNAGIRSFGLAAILGEAACLAAALSLVPALLAWMERDTEQPGQEAKA